MIIWVGALPRPEVFDPFVDKLSDKMTGQVISHYKILEKPPTLTGQVGEGGMSVV